MRVEHYRCEHLRLLHVQGVQPHQVSYVAATYASVSRPPGLAMTAFVDDRILLCGGIIPNAPAVGLLWAVVAADAGQHMLCLHRAVERFLTIERWRRIEATVEVGFPPGRRWLRMLGFKYEGRMPGFGPGGETHLRFGKVL